jgi:hypothetical protein
MNPLILLAALSLVLFVTNNMALAFIVALMALLIFYHQNKREGYQNYDENGKLVMESIQDNSVPYLKKSDKAENKIREYVPYTISPFLEAPYMNKNIKGNDPMSLNNLNVEKSGSAPAPKSNLFAGSVASPQACLEGNAMFSTDMGCIKLGPEQIALLSSRGGNMDPRRSYV